MNDPIYNEFDYRGFHIKIMLDTDPQSPADWENLGTFYSNCRSFNPYNHEIDEVLETDDDGAKHVDSDYIFIRVYAYIHGGIALSTNRTGQFADPWDSGFAGIMAVHKDKVLKEYGDLSPETVEKVYKVLEGEVQDWDDYCQGNVYGYEVTHGDDFSDSCWGYYGGPSYATDEAKSVVDWVIKNRDIWEQKTIQFDVA